MLITLSLAVALAAQTRTDLPKINFELPVVGGQREMILGPSVKEAALLNGYSEKEVGAKHLTTPDNTGGYTDSWIPGGMSEESLGYLDCGTRKDTIFNKDCLVITTTAKWNQKVGHKPHELKWQNVAKQQWWVLADGTILRQYSTLQTLEGTQVGDCTYGKDSIQRRYTDIHGQTSFGEIFPSCGMEALYAQFKPMVVDGKVVLREKEFSVLNPLTGGLDKYSVHVAGTFKGLFLNANFKGKLFDVEGPNHLFEKVFLDDTGDLVKVALNDEKFFVISVVPSSHLDEYGRPLPKSGG